MEKKYRLRFYYSIFLGVFTAVVGILFLAEAAELYYSGVEALGATRGMYSREAVGARLLEMLTPLILWLVAILFGVAVYAVFPAPPVKKGRLDAIVLCRRLEGRVSAEKDPAAFQKLRRMQTARLIVRVFSAVFCLTAAAMCIVYLADTAHFTSLEALNRDVLHMVAGVLPWVGAAFVVLIGEAVFEGIFAKKMLSALRPLVGGASVKRKGTAAVCENRYVVFGVRIALFALAAVFIVLGALPQNGGANSVFIKAINICTECIGLG